ncbi:MFS transporter [Microbispora sp. H11081]|uniref:MFS transporter n=1 Tax=Microbispora sp. H11081 TaxID=2729107 RepID=UPI0014763B16|nr:MFS transporter [Microbispora sp. H11081]
MTLGPAFVRLWLAGGASQFGTQVTVLALPLVALHDLDAGELGVGALFAASFLPYVVVGLPAGALVDRWDHRTVLLACDAARAVLLLAVPAAMAAGLLSLWLLIAVAALVGTATVFSEVAASAVLPSIVAAEDLTRANARIETTRATALVLGPGLGGVLIRVAGAAPAVVADIASYAVSFALLLGTPRTPARTRDGGRPALRAEIAEGLRFVVRHRILRPVLTGYSASVFFIGMYQAMSILYMTEVIHLGSAQIGIVMGLGNLGFVGGALLSRRIAGWIGTGGAIVAALGLLATGFLVSAAAGGWWAMPCLVLGQIVSSLGTPVYNVNLITLRQTITPAGLIGRVTAASRTLGRGLVPVGAMAGAGIATVAGPRASVVAAGVGGLLALLPLLASPVPSMRTLDRPVTDVS